MSRELGGRTAFISGGSQGLGFAIARAYVEAGASLMLCGRDQRMLHQAQVGLSELAGTDQAVRTTCGDVSKPEAVDRMVTETLETFPRIDILVNNAGVYGPKGLVDEIDWEAWRYALEVNLLGSVMMCRAFLPHFKQNGYGKIIQLSGGGATNPLPRLSAYAASKAAVVRFAETLAEEVKAWKVDVNAIAPGALDTRLLDEVLEAGPEKVGEDFYQRMTQLKADGGTPLEKGADLAVFLASAASDGITGKLISAVWDPWAALPGHLDDLRSSDVYTLRRIVPRDRGMTWGG